MAKAIEVDSFDVRFGVLGAKSCPPRKRRLLYNVLSAAGFGLFGRPSPLWRMRAFQKERGEGAQRPLEGCRGRRAGSLWRLKGHPGASSVVASFFEVWV
jgi:hypothetical protein